MLSQLLVIINYRSALVLQPCQELQTSFPLNLMEQLRVELSGRQLKWPLPCLAWESGTVLWCFLASVMSDSLKTLLKSFIQLYF